MLHVTCIVKFNTSHQYRQPLLDDSICQLPFYLLSLYTYYVKLSLLGIAKPRKVGYTKSNLRYTSHEHNKTICSSKWFHFLLLVCCETLWLHAECKIDHFPIYFVQLAICFSVLGHCLEFCGMIVFCCIMVNWMSSRFSVV